MPGQLNPRRLTPTLAFLSGKRGIAGGTALAVGFFTAGFWMGQGEERKRQTRILPQPRSCCQGAIEVTPAMKAV